MAIDAELLARAEEGERWLRLYAWEPCLSFGRHEPAARRYDADRIAARGLAVVRRPTGGRAVWHANELTYALAGPSDGLGSLREAYATIHTMLRDALRSLGADAELAPDRAAAPIDAGACFAVAAGGEVLVGNRKVIGSAQVRQGSALLQHGSVLLGDATDYSVPLSRALARPVSWADVASAIRDAAHRRWRVLPPESGVSGVLQHALRHADRFRSEAWTWQ